MEGLYAIHIEPESLTDPNPIGYVNAGDTYEARHRAANVMKIGFDIRVYPVWMKEQWQREYGMNW